MTPEILQPILREVLGEDAGPVEAIAETDWGSVWAFAVCSAEADWSVWDVPLKRLRTALADHHLWPLLSGDEEKVRAVAYSYEHNVDHSKHDSRVVLAEGLAPRGTTPPMAEGVLADKTSALSAQRQGHEEPFDDFADYDWERAGPLWDEADIENEARARQVFVEKHARRPQEVWFLLVPARAGWEVPAVLCFGAWDGCPSPSEHVSLAYQWHQEYGAQLSGLTHNSLSFNVSRPPQSREEALPLARQQWDFCFKYIWEGMDDVPSIEQKADELVARVRWNFMWG